MTFRTVSSLFVVIVSLFLSRSASAACSLGDHTGVDDAEAKTASRIMCHELATRAAPSQSFEVTFGKLGGRTLVSVTEGGDAAREVRTFVNGLDEVDIAAPRLAQSLIEAKPLGDTRNADNVLAEEGRASKKVASAVGATMGMYVLSGLGAPASPSAGIDLGLAFRTGHLGLSADGRWGGMGSGDTKINNASLDVGARLYLTDGEFAPFVGGGAAMSWFHNNSPNASQDRSGSGGSAFAAVGVEALRSSHAGLVAALRVDLPFYELETVTPNRSSYLLAGRAPPPTPAKTTAYVAPISLTVALAFH